jgi:hypothetical protein
MSRYRRNRYAYSTSTSDWQDAFPHRYGYTINTQALYYKLLFCMKNLRKQKIKKKQQMKIKMMVMGEKKGFYYSYRWKNHGKYKEVSDWFDSLGNLLAVLFGLSTKEKTKKILEFIEKNKINKPYPVKAIYPPITKKSKHWEEYFLDCDAGIPNKYLNGGIWGYIGGFYVLALIKEKKFKKAKQELLNLSKRNLSGNFPEWTDPLTKKHYGNLQAWEAGMYILAYESLKQKEVLV